MKNDGFVHIVTIVVFMDLMFSLLKSEKSRVFIKVTKTKTLAAYGQIVDVLFANNKFPLSIDPTELPEGVVADVHFDPQEPEQLRGETALSSPYGFAGDGQWNFRRVLQQKR